MTRKIKQSPACDMVRVYRRTADVCHSKTTFARIQREAAERMVDDYRARWVLADAIQRTDPIPGVLSDLPTITDSECEINAGAYAGRGRRAADRLSPAQVTEVRSKVGVWPEIYDRKAPLPGHYRRSACINSAPGVTVMSREELEQLTKPCVVFIDLGSRSYSDLVRKKRMRLTDDDFVQQHYVDDERASPSDVPIGYHEVDSSESES